MAKSKRISDLKPGDLHVKLGLSRSYATELLKRQKRPSLEVAFRIEAEFGVPAGDWLHDDAGAAA
jgi:transcriptional regulator with XRE-family HTH domain